MARREVVVEAASARRFAARTPFTDPLAGSLSDHWKSRHGRRHPFMYASILPLMVSFYLLFNPLVASEFGMFLWLLVFSNATRTSMSLYHVPHIGLGAELSEDYDERSKLVGYRMFFANVGVLFTFAVAFLYFFAPTAEFENGQLNAGAYPGFALLLAGLMGVTIFWSGWGNAGPRFRSCPSRPPHRGSASARSSGASSSTSSPRCAAARSAGCSSACSSSSSW